jgi:hypothetical protein
LNFGKLAICRQNAYYSGMADFPLKVKRRDATGAVAEVLCDDVKGARENLQHFRNAGYHDVWVEDADGRKVGEKTL